MWFVITYSVLQSATATKDNLSGLELKGSVTDRQTDRQTMTECHPRKEFWYSVEPSLQSTAAVCFTQKQQEAEETVLVPPQPHSWQMTCTNSEGRNVDD